MIMLIFWIIFGLIVGLCAKIIHPGDEPVGCLPTVAIGICGSFVGGGINWFLHGASGHFHPSGFLMSILGGVLCCMFWRWYTLKTSSSGAKSFFTGKRLD